MLRILLPSLVLLGALAPAASASDVVICPECIDPCWDCIVIQPCIPGRIVSACVYTDPNGCLVAVATLHSQTLVISRTIPGQDVSTTPIDAGPVHVDPIHVYTDPVTVGPYVVVTPGRTVSNTFCPGSQLA